MNQLTKLTLSDGSTVAYEYDSVGRRTKMTDQHGATAYAWDSLGRLTGVQWSGINPTYYHYDINNRIVSIVDPSGRTIYNTYDPLRGITAVN